METQEFISIKEACQILSCGRTKIYTHYIKEGLLTIKMKRGNRSFFLKSDVIAIRDIENTPREYILHGQGQNFADCSEENFQHLNSREHGTSTARVFHHRSAPTRTTMHESGEIFKPEDSQNLLSRIRELEDQLLQQDQQIAEFQQQLNNTIPLVEYHKELEESQRLVEQTREQLKQSEESLHCAKEQSEQISIEKERLGEQFGQSLHLAVQLKRKLEQEQQRKTKLRELQLRWKELQLQLGQCGFFDISSRIQIHREIKQIQESIQKFR